MFEQWQYYYFGRTKVICKQQKSVSFAHLVNNCEVKLLQISEKISEVCDKRIINSNSSIFIQLVTSNTWLFAVPHPESLTNSCENERKPIDII